MTEKERRGVLVDILDECPVVGKFYGLEMETEGIADYLSNNGVVAIEWIPVTERLPEEVGRFLVYGNRGGIYTAEFRKFGDFGGEYPHWHKLNSKSHYCEPTHWMPLPEPPADMRKESKV